MASFIANQIIKHGQQKYVAYFINTTIYAKWQDEVDAILIELGHEDLIVK